MLVSVCRGVYGVLLACTCVLVLITAPSAGAANSLYWSNGTLFGTIGNANLNGSGGADLNSGGVSFGGPGGIAINPAANRMYVVDAVNNDIASVDLDGGGGGVLNVGPAPMSTPTGIVVDPGHDKIYWTSTGNAAIGYANLDGSDGGTLNVGLAPISVPTGITLDQTSHKLYWGEANFNAISYVDLDDASDSGSLPLGGAPIFAPYGVALDVAHNKIYWANHVASSIGFANLDGSGSGGTLDTMGSNMNTPVGVAVDPDANRIYWGDSGATPPQVDFANRDNTGGGGVFPTTGATTSNPNFVAVLKVPEAASAPPVSPSSATPGQSLSCDANIWRGNDLGAFLYREPQSVTVQWQRNGVDIAGATTPSLVADTAGDFTCVATATNHAGSIAAKSNSATVANPTPPGPTPPTPTPTPAANCPTVRVSIEKPYGRRGRKRAGSWSPGVRLLAGASSAANLTITATGTATSRTTGKRASFKLQQVTDMYVPADSPRRFHLLLFGKNKRLLPLGQVVRLKVSATPTPRIAGCKAQAATTRTVTARISKIVTTGYY